MNEAETRAEYIDPALQAAGWGVVEAKAWHKSRIYLSPPSVYEFLFSFKRRPVFEGPMFVSH